MASPAAKSSGQPSRQVILETPRLILRAAKLSDATPLHDNFKDPELMRYWSSLPHKDLAETQSWVQSMTKSSQNGVTDFVIALKRPPTSSSGDQMATMSENPNSDSSNIETIPIGKAGIFSSIPSNEIGFQISRAYWGRGFAKEALTYLLNYLFDLPRSDASAETESINTHGDQYHQEDERPTRDREGNADEDTPDCSAYTSLTLAEKQKDIPWRYPSITADADPRNVACLGVLASLGFVKTGFAERTFCIGGEWVDSVFFRLEREIWITRRDGKK